jgi:hypothetical protein
MTSAATVLPVRCSCSDFILLVLLLSNRAASPSSTAPASASTSSPATSSRPAAGLTVPAGDCAPFSSRCGDASADWLCRGDCLVPSCVPPILLSPAESETISNPSSDGGFPSEAAPCADSLSVIGAIRAFPPLRLRFDLLALLLRSFLRLLPAPSVVSMSSSISL